MISLPVDMFKLCQDFKAAIAEFVRTCGDDQTQRLEALL